MESISINNPESLSPKSKSNPIQGILVNLLYLKNGDNLAAVVIKEDFSGNLFTLTAESDLMDEVNAIQIDNLKDFQFRIQDTLNYDSLLSIYYENNNIDSLVIIKQNQNIRQSQPLEGPRPPVCHFPPRLC